MDRTLLAVRNQLGAFQSVSMFEVGLYLRAEDKMWSRIWDAAAVIRSIPFLKQKNATGHDIFIRPSGCSGFLFFDDLSRSKILNLKADGFASGRALDNTKQETYRHKGFQRTTGQNIIDKKQIGPTSLPANPGIDTGICARFPHNKGTPKSAVWPCA